MAVKEDRKDLDTTLLPDGQQKDYLVLPEAKTPEEYRRPIRKAYRHEKCGNVTTMGDRLAGATFCCACGEHFPVGVEGEFVWLDGTKVGS